MSTDSFVKVPPFGLAGPGRRAALITGLSILLVVVLGGGWLLATRVFGREELKVTAEASTEGSRAVRINASNATISVEPSTDGFVHLRAGGHYTGSAPEVSARTNNGETTVTVKCNSSWLGWCTIDATVQLPAGLPVVASSDNGDITATGLHNDVSVTTNNGDLTINGGGNTLSAISDNGDITIKNSAATTVKVRTDNGAIDIGLTAVPHQVEARSHNGNIDLAVSGTSKYVVDAHSDNGSVKVEVGVDTDSPNKLTAVTDNGNVRVRAL